jgi:hypothetical protein
VNKNVLDKQKLEQMLAEKRRNVVSENQLATEMAQFIAMNWVWKIKKYSKSIE